MNDINEKLAKAMGYKNVRQMAQGDAVIGDITCTIVGCELTHNYREVDFQDPAIFAECVKWLLDNGFVMKKTSCYGGRQMYAVINGASMVPDTRDADLFKAAALAVIAASEVE